MGFFPSWLGIAPYCGSERLAGLSRDGVLAIFPGRSSPFEVKWPKIGIRGNQLPLGVILQFGAIFHLLDHFLGPKWQDMCPALKEANVRQTLA